MVVESVDDFGGEIAYESCEGKEEKGEGEEEGHVGDVLERGEVGDLVLFLEALA
jgi:hypothetical protein